jgi:DNA primase
MKPMEGAVSQIKEKLDIVEFLRGYMPLAQAGKNFKGKCPFHNEKTPSFMVSPERQSWHCFGCGLGGDSFAFLMKYENLEFGEALKILAEKTGIELRRVEPREYKVFGLLYELQDAAKDFFKEQLKTAKIAQDYLKTRGLLPETIEEFELGFAPNDNDSLATCLLKKGYDPADVLRAGLIGKSERGTYYDRFRGRIMFPIHNHLGKVVGFTGRILPQLDTGDMGKYVNSPETAIFNKSKLLYGFWKTKPGIRDSGTAFLVEGQMDMLMSYQAGVKNVVATSGTALTPDHILALRKIAQELLVSFDNDEAGFAAGERAVDLAEAGGMQVKVVTLGGVKDPADAAEKDPAGLMKSIGEAEPAFKVFFRRYLPQGKVDVLNISDLKALRLLLNKIKSVASPVEKDYWLKELATHTKQGESSLREEMEKIQPIVVSERFAEEAAKIPEKKYSRWERIGQDLLGAVYEKNNSDFLDDVSQYLDSAAKAALALLKTGERRSKNPEQDAFVDMIILASRAMEEKEIEELKSALKQEFVKMKRNELTARIKEAEVKGDEAGVEKILKDIQLLS